MADKSNCTGCFGHVGLRQLKNTVTYVATNLYTIIVYSMFLLSVLIVILYMN